MIFLRLIFLMLKLTKLQLRLSNKLVRKTMSSANWLVLKRSNQWTESRVAAQDTADLTSPARLGLPLTEEVAELSVLMEEALGLLFRRVDLLFELFALVGVVEGKPIRVTLWTGANKPNLGKHWKYLWSKRIREVNSLQVRCVPRRTKTVTVAPHLVPATAPSFLPRGSSSSTPHQSPLAKSVSPRNRTTPALVPPTYTDTVIITTFSNQFVIFICGIISENHTEESFRPFSTTLFSGSQGSSST